MSLRSRLGRRWRSISFRSGLLSALSVGIVASLAFLVVAVLVFVLFALTGAVSETSLVDRAEDQLRLGVEPADLDLESTLEELRRPRGEGIDAFWVVSSDGEVLNSDGVINQAVLDAGFNDNEFGADLDSTPQPTDSLGIKSVGDQDWFYFEREVALPTGETYLIVTANSGTFNFADFALSSLPVAIPILLVLMGVAMAVTSWLTRRALRRVENIRSEVELITQQSLNRRVPIVDASDDVEKLAYTMNDMLGRLETSSAQQAQFLADASHELRSPVAGLLAQLEVATTYPDRVDTSTLLPKLRDEAQRLQLLVDDLLFLSRSEAESGTSSNGDGFIPVEVGALLAGEVAHQKMLDAAVSISADSAGEAYVTGNPRDLERAVRNLTDNAIRHCEDKVRLTSRTDGENVLIRVTDDGPGISTDDQERIFKRFVRLDEARSRDAGGSGLGLAITAEIAAKHGGTIQLVDSANPGATFELTLPRTNASR